MRGLIVDIYDGVTNCSANGISARHKTALLVGPGVPPVFEDLKDRPTVELVTRDLRHVDGPYITAVPVERGTGAGPMFGGAFIWTSDQRFGELLRGLYGNAGQVGPVPLHDRWER